MDTRQSKLKSEKTVPSRLYSHEGCAVLIFIFLGLSWLFVRADNKVQYAPVKQKKTEQQAPEFQMRPDEYFRETAEAGLKVALTEEGLLTEQQAQEFEARISDIVTEEDYYEFMAELSDALVNKLAAESQMSVDAMEQ